jgi:hypothetical protein
MVALAQCNRGSERGHGQTVERQGNQVTYEQEKVRREILMPRDSDLVAEAIGRSVMERVAAAEKEMAEMELQERKAEQQGLLQQARGVLIRLFNLVGRNAAEGR